MDEKKLVDFKLKLRHDGLTQTSFVEAVTHLYLQGDHNFLAVLSDVKDRHSRIGKRRSSLTMKSYAEGQDALDRYLLTDEDKNSLYDILDIEYGEV